MMYRAFRYPLRPNKAQEAILELYLLRTRQVYNAALEQRIDAYRKQGKKLTRYDQQKDLTQLRNADPDFDTMPVNVLRSALKRLDSAYEGFFRRIRSGGKLGKPGFPRFKTADRFKSFSFMAAPKIEGSKILVPKLGFVAFHQYREFKGQPYDAVISRDCSGKWFVSVQCNLGDAPVKIAPISHTGVDVGLVSFATFSDGSKVDNPRFFRKGEEVLARRNQALALKTKGSASHQRAKRLAAKSQIHVRNQRLDFARKLVVNLFSRLDLVSYEDLNINGMAHGKFSKSIFDAAWGLFIHVLICKAEGAGKWAVGVDPRGTSQRCSRCGATVKKTLADREHNCECGLSLDRDHNAAINVDTLGLSVVDKLLAR